ncbi:RhoGAP-domain-containing protein [Auriscalpium vulgare]|uniref:RhoGAP-domain-containing protein n=1 Tax=Auriscalpium vulgare TaxID=40419 RepID=A0ACB8RTN2_9AGAM|nr:RhoGAP-domain-containing protein [Auriscalpium vulgare]
MSSAAEVPSRTSGDDLQNGLLSQFDLHLRVLTDSYLNFFQERKRVEETYVDSLTKLHRKAMAIDAFLDVRLDATTTRVAWREVRDNVERETQARQAFMNTLAMDVILPLVSFKESQERTRKRIKEDIRESATAHSDFAESQLPKLKRTYLKKCQDVEDYKQTVTSPVAAAPAPMFQDTGAVPTSRSNPNLVTKPVVTAPQPLRALERRPSGSARTTRSRSPPTSSSLSDLAHHGKKQLNQLITFLDKSGNNRELGSSRNQENAARSVRAKREAEEADREYRKAVHWHETLRLRRVKILENAHNSLGHFHYEEAELMKKVLTMYTDNLIATCQTQTHIASYAQDPVRQVDPRKDMEIMSGSVRRSLALAIPKPVLYYNYQVGECRDLIFGVSMVDYATARGLEDAPKIIRLCIQEVDKRGLTTEGIYRVSGRHAIVQELQHKIERNEQDFAFNSYTDDIYSITSLLKLYLRELPEPLFRFPLQERMQHTEDIANHVSNGFVLLRSKIRRLPPVHRASLKALVEHLARVAANADKNKMDAKNLAIAFGGVLFGEDEMPASGADLLSLQSWKDSVMEDMIENAQTLFDDRQAPMSPPLPPAPSGEPVPVLSYGSSHTRIGSLSSPKGPRFPLAADSDFTPQLPPRPANSIHPSARTGPLPLALDPGRQAQRREAAGSANPSPTSTSTLSSEATAPPSATAQEFTPGQGSPLPPGAGAPVPVMWRPASEILPPPQDQQ